MPILWQHCLAAGVSDRFRNAAVVSCQLCLFATTWTAADQAPLSMGFYREEYWSGSLCSPRGDLPNAGIIPRFPALQVNSLPAELPGKPRFRNYAILFGHLMQRVDSLEKTLMLGGIGGRRRRGRQRMRWLDGITDSITWVWVNHMSWWLTGRPGVLRFMGSQRVGQDWATELNPWY